MKIVPYNHQWCLKELHSHSDEFLDQFPDITTDFCALHFSIELAELLRETFTRRIGEPVTREILSEPQSAYQFARTAINLFKEREMYAEAFGFGVLYYVPFSDNENVVKNLRDFVVADLNKYKKNLKIFKPLMQQYFGELKKHAFYYLDFLFDIKSFGTLYLKDIDKEEIVLSNDFGEKIDLQISLSRKRFNLEFYPSGKVAFIYSIVDLIFECLINHRFKQARHLIAVAAELMKTVNQDTQPFKKLLDMFYMAKTIYLGKLLAVSELHEIVSKSSSNASVANEILPKDKIIDFGITLPDGEDPELPVELVTDAAKRAEIYKKLHKYKKQLEKSSLPHISEIYGHIIKCERNYYDDGNDDHISAVNDKINADSCKIQ